MVGLRVVGLRIVEPRIFELKDLSEWRERLPLDFGRECAQARRRSGMASAGRSRPFSS